MLQRLKKYAEGALDVLNVTPDSFQDQKNIFIHLSHSNDSSEITEEIILYNELIRINELLMKSFLDLCIHDKNQL